MAIARRSIDLWGYVQRALLEEVRPGDGGSRTNTVRLPVPPTLTMREVTDPGWHSDRHEARAATQLAALESALTHGQTHRAARRRSAWLRTLHADRLERTRSLACGLGLRCDPMGRGPLVDEPAVHYRDRLPWVIEPVSPYGDPSLPARAGAILDEWNAAGDVFDRFYRADEPPTSQLVTQSLIGVVSTDGKTSDWFVLDRWAS